MFLNNSLKSFAGSAKAEYLGTALHKLHIKEQLTFSLVSYKDHITGLQFAVNGFSTVACLNSGDEIAVTIDPISSNRNIYNKILSFLRSRVFYRKDTAGRETTDGQLTSIHIFSELDGIENA